MNNFFDRVYGCAVGAAVGDALGMPLEFGPPQPDNNPVTEMKAGRLPAGTFTDDTEMALAVATSLIQSNPIDPHDVAQRFLVWAESNPPDIGIQTRLVLDKIKQGKTWLETKQWMLKTRPDAAGNGSAMRCWPVALAHWQNWSQNKHDTILQNEITHPHPDCISACIFINHLISNALLGSELLASIPSAYNEAAFSNEFLQRLMQAPSKTRNQLANSGWVQHSLESVVWSLSNTNSFKDAVIQVVNLGNDADTAGAIIGAIAGAFYGLSTIPNSWLNQLQGFYPPNDPMRWNVEQIKDIAKKLMQQNLL
ncbi:MAG: hypothetical protein CL609_09905 [Anaerolineaceae bacterium]|nr:hypothetical protein [Anaerolineaceae bacterium]